MRCAAARGRTLNAAGSRLVQLLSSASPMCKKKKVFWLLSVQFSSVQFSSGWGGDEVSGVEWSGVEGRRRRREGTGIGLRMSLHEDGMVRSCVSCGDVVCVFVWLACLWLAGGRGNTNCLPRMFD